MVLEIVQFDIAAGRESEFEAGYAKGKAIFARAKGCLGTELHRSIEQPNRYRLFVRWQTLENHTVDFRGSADYPQWRALVAHCFASPAEVEHVNQVLLFGRMSSELRLVLVTAAQATSDLKQRAIGTLYLTAISGEFLVYTGPTFLPN